MLLVFTDLDGTLLNSDDYSYQAALPTVRKLQAQNVPIIPVTSKTRAEVEVLCQQIRLQDGFIVENGSAIFIPQVQNVAANVSAMESVQELENRANGALRFANDTLQASSYSRKVENPATPQNTYQIQQFGCSYAEARTGLAILAQQLGVTLTGFGDLTEVEIADLTGLSLVEAQRAKQREFTEPFITPKAITSEQIQQITESLGFEVVIGDRFSHLIGQDADKGRATQWLINQYQASNPQTKVMAIGLGNSPNDLPMLEVMDLPIIIPGKQGPHPGLANRAWPVAAAPGAMGWAAAMESYDSLLNSQ
ncbi:MAG: HAD-IIB family hydrolase [Microcoleaceae cyanobacterium]